MWMYPCMIIVFVLTLSLVQRHEDVLVSRCALEVLLFKKKGLLKNIIIIVTVREKVGQEPVALFLYQSNQSVIDYLYLLWLCLIF